MKKRYAFYGFRDEDYRAAETWLEGWKARGWELERVLAGCIAVFVPLSCPEMRYTVDLVPSRRREESQEGWVERQAEYRQLCADAGWEQVGESGAQRIYKSIRGQNPVPLQTDPELEQARFQRQVVRPAVESTASVLVTVVLSTVLFFYAERRAVYWFELLLHPGELLALGMIGLGLLWQLYKLFHVCRYGWKLRRAQGEVLPSPSLRGARVRAWGDALWLPVLAAALLSTLWTGNLRTETPLDPAQLAEEGRPVVTAADLGGITRTDDIMWQEGSGLLSTVSFVQSRGLGGILYVERYDAATSALAGQVFRELEQKADQDETKAILCGRGEGTAIPVEVSGAEESVLYQYERGEYLILRRGKTVVRLMADLDFTDPALLATIVSQTKLGA